MVLAVVLAVLVLESEIAGLSCRLVAVPVVVMPDGWTWCVVAAGL